MSIEGRLTIDLYPGAGRPERVGIQSSRPLQAAKIFRGKTPEALLGQLPLVFSVCAVAQAAAATRAIQEALGLQVNGSVDAARLLLVQLETAREHLWRIAIDWPGFVGEEPDAAQAALLQALLPVCRKALFADGDAFALRADCRATGAAVEAAIARLDELLTGLVFGCSPAEWLTIDSAEALDEWSHGEASIAARLLHDLSRRGWQALGATDCRLLPALSATALNRRLDSPDADRFIAEPVWEQHTCETTPLARQYDAALVRSLRSRYGSGLLARLAARLVELAGIPGTMRQLAAQLGSDDPVPREETLPPGTGIGQVEAARGRLVHRVELAHDTVKRYQILAPTEWNFHPAGVVAAGLGSLAESDEAILHSQAAMLVNAVDPCVGYELRVH